MFESAAEALKYIADHDIAMVDLKVVGLAGQWLHITIPSRNFTQKYFEEGVGYDGSSGSGFAKVESGDVCARPEPKTGFIDPFWELPTLSFICETIAADTKEPFDNDPRTIARKSLEYLRSTGAADEAWMAPEFEFHVFDEVEVINDPFHTSVSIHSAETHPDGDAPAIPPMRGYLRVPPAERLHDLRSEIVMCLQGMGIPVRYHHHEVGAPGQCEIEINLEPMIRAADSAMIIKYVIKNVAHRRGKLATFMPKPVYGEAGNGMHVHQKLEKGGKPIFYDVTEQNYANLSDIALQYTGGLLNHGAALTGITNPSTNSFKRLVEGHEAPVNLFFSLANRSAAVRVPRYAIAPKDKRIEYRPPDFTGNIYLTLAAMLMAGIDGIESKIDVQAAHLGPFDVDICKQPVEFTSKIAAIPRTLYDALDALQADHAFLAKGNVFPDSFIQGWVEGKRMEETEKVATRPHPYEYEMYLDV